MGEHAHAKNRKNLSEKAQAHVRDSNTAQRLHQRAVKHDTCAHTSRNTRGSNHGQDQRCSE